MFQYVAFIGNNHDALKGNNEHSLMRSFQIAHQDWTQFSDERCGLSVFHKIPAGRPQTAIVFPLNMGVVFGSIFPRNLNIRPTEWKPCIDLACAETIVRSRGRHLVREFWGSYIAFLVDRDKAAHYVLRDCSGKYQCYFLQFGQTTIVASNIEDLSCLNFPRFSINHRYLAGFLYHAEMAHSECAVNEIQELLAGECLVLKNGNASRHAIWDPREICREQVIDNFDAATHQVQTVTQACVDFWASGYSRIVHHLSGGLDSSVVLGCLKRSAYRPLVTCVYLESAGAGESELRYAEMAAVAAGFELLVQDDSQVEYKYDERIFRLPKSPKPSVAHIGIAIDPHLGNLMPSLFDAEAIWDGQGGDHIFFSPNTAYGAIDYAFRRGISRGFSTRVQDAMRLSKKSYWDVLYKSIRLGLFSSKWRHEDEYDREATFLNPELLPADIIDYVWQPWSTDSADLPPGKRLQISLLGNLIHRHRSVPGPQAVEHHHPLFSQPLFELCLRIPIYTLLQGGINRALERAAFRDRVPEPIIQRHDKGSITTSFMSDIRRSMPFVRDLMLDDVLARERIIDRSALEPYLMANRPINHRVLWPFLSCIAAEVWARKWADSGWRI